jgi:hypothetical protein
VEGQNVIAEGNGGGYFEVVEGSGGDAFAAVAGRVVGR